MNIFNSVRSLIKKVFRNNSRSVKRGIDFGEYKRMACADARQRFNLEKYRKGYPND